MEDQNCILFFQKFLKGKKMQNSSRYTQRGPSIAERITRFIRNLLQKPVFLKSKADWLSELPPISKEYIITIPNSTKMAKFKLVKKQMNKNFIPIFKIEEIDNNQNIN